MMKALLFFLALATTAFGQITATIQLADNQLKENFLKIPRGGNYLTTIRFVDAQGDRELLESGATIDWKFFLPDGTEIDDIPVSANWVIESGSKSYKGSINTAGPVGGHLDYNTLQAEIVWTVPTGPVTKKTPKFAVQFGDFGNTVSAPPTILAELTPAAPATSATNVSVANPLTEGTVQAQLEAAQAALDQAVLFSTQSLSDSEKAQARANLGVQNQSPAKSFLTYDTLVIVEGDSISDDGLAGSHGARWGSFLNSSPIKTVLNLTYSNQANSGDRLLMLESRAASTVIPAIQAHNGPATVISNVITNDATHGTITAYGGPAGWVARYEDWAKSLQAEGAKVVVLTGLTRTGASELAQIRECNELMRESEIFDAVVDMDPVLSDHTDTDYFLGDGLHPNADGSYLIFRAVAKTLLPHLSDLTQESPLLTQQSVSTSSGLVLGDLTEYLNDSDASQNGIPQGGLYLKSGGGVFANQLEPIDYGTIEVVDDGDAGGTTQIASSWDSIDVQITDFSSASFLRLRSDTTLGTKIYIINTNNSLTGGSNRIGIIPISGQSRILNANGPDGFGGGASSTSYILGPVAFGTHLLAESLDGSILEWRVVVP